MQLSITILLTRVTESITLGWSRAYSPHTVWITKFLPVSFTITVRILLTQSLVPFLKTELT